MNISGSPGDLLSFASAERTGILDPIQDQYSGTMVAFAILNRDVDRHFLGRMVTRLCDRFSLDASPFNDSFSGFNVKDLGDPALRRFLESLVGNVVLSRIRAGKFSFNLADIIMLSALTSNPLVVDGDGMDLSMQGNIMSSTSNGDLILGIMGKADPATALGIARYIAKRVGHEGCYRRSVFRQRDGVDLRPVKFISPASVSLLSLGIINEGVKRASEGADYLHVGEMICSGLAILVNFKEHLRGTPYMDDVNLAMNAMITYIPRTEAVAVKARAESLYGELVAHTQRVI